ncbi:MAG: efflux RND transporter periplasmic adaptor subunit [Cyanobacteria bacterium SZAS LIN-2]|nr:efflux RND transporter periplasmic adaptor subunit [Cyanobacteria bacterium SZAS LIN-2]
MGTRLRQFNIGALLLSAVATVLLTACSSQESPGGESKKAGEGAGEHKAAVTAEVPVVKVALLKLNRDLDLPGELEAYQNVPMHAKVEGFVKSIVVDRGSTVKRGQVLLTIACPELKEKEEEAQAKVSSAQSAMRQAEETVASQSSKLVEANARLDSDTLTLSRLQQAAQTPGAIAQNEIDMQLKTVEADKARVESLKSEVKAARALVVSQKDNVIAAKNVLEALGAMRSYLTITAPFDGVVTERNVHEGSIVAVDSSRSSLPLLRVQQKNILRLVVAVPEECVAGLKNGAQIAFSVPAFLGQTFYGKIARLGFALDAKTRTMPVELNVDNAGGGLEPGMFATVHWHASRPYETMFVPNAAVATTLKGTFVVLVQDGKTKQVPVTKGQSMGDKVEIVGEIKPGDTVVLKGTDEYKDGAAIVTRAASEDDLNKARNQTAGGGE